MEEAKHNAWILAIEALLHTKQLPLSFIIDLIRSAPPLLLTTNATQLLRLRVMEDMYNAPTKNTTTFQPHGSNTQLNVQTLCEQALQRLLKGASLSNVGLNEAFSHDLDIHSFILEKRSLVKKCSLHQLKNGILQGRDPIFKSFKDRSGLQVPDENSRIPFGEEVEQDVSVNTEAKKKLASFTAKDDQSSEDNLCISKLQSAKRVRNDPEPCRTLEESPWKLKRVLLCFPKKPFEVSASPCQHEKFGESSSRNVEHIEEPSRGNEDHCADASERFKGNNDIDLGVVFRVNISGVVFPYQKLVPNPDAPSEDMHLEGDAQGKFCDKTSGGNDITLEPTVITVNVGGENLEEYGPGEANDSISDSFQHDVDVAMSKDNDVHADNLEISSDSGEYHDIRTDIAMRKNNFLSSQGRYTEDSLGTQLNSCVKCNKGGNVLSCTSINCPLVVHEGCLGSAIGFDRMGNFYCPFCAYSHAISRYEEAKKKFSRTRTNLMAFHVFGADLEEKSSSKMSHGSRGD